MDNFRVMGCDPGKVNFAWAIYDDDGLEEHGIIEGAEAVDSYTGFCGDSMKVYLKVEKGLIRNAKFQAIGCAGAFASGSALTEMVRGKTLEEAEKITEQDVIKDLGDLPGPKIHCARLAVDALRKAIESYAKQ